jgi:anti-anti-sigma regulatory factor
VAISRALGTVVVTVHGSLSSETSGQLRHILWDLIDQQGNRNVVVDLRDTTVGPRAGLEVFEAAADVIERLGGTFTLSGPPDEIVGALAAGGSAKVISRNAG